MFGGMESKGLIDEEHRCPCCGGRLREVVSKVADPDCDYLSNPDGSLITFIEVHSAQCEGCGLLFGRAKKLETLLKKLKPKEMSHEPGGD